MLQKIMLKNGRLEGKKKNSIDYTAQEMLMKRENEWKDFEIVNILVIENDWCRQKLSYCHEFIQ